MAVEGLLQTWLELVDASPVLRFEEIDQFLRELYAEDENCEKDSLIWNQGCDTLIQFRLTYWDNQPPDFVEALDALAEHLKPDEYLVFEEKSRYGPKPYTLRVIMLSSAGVAFMTSENLHTQLFELTKLKKVVQDGADI